MDGYHSQDRLHKLRGKINEQHLNYLFLEEVPVKHEIRLKLITSIRDYLLISPPSHKYLLTETPTILHLSSLTPSFTPYKASLGFDAISKYASNLIAQPWRREYKQIKTYSGYYKHSIEANLDGAERMFEVMGYRMGEGAVLNLEGPVCPDDVTCAGLDALFAYVECQILKEIYDDIYKSGISPVWSDIVDFRETHTCSPQQAARALCKYNSSTAHAQLIDTDTDSGGVGAGGYYNSAGLLGGYKGSNGQAQRELFEEQQAVYGNIGGAGNGHALAATYSFPPLRHHTQRPQYDPASFPNMDYYNRYNGLCDGVAMQAYYGGHHHGTPLMYPVMKQQPPPCCCSNGYMLDMSVPSQSAISPMNCLCNQAITTSSIVPTAQLIDLDNSIQPPRDAVDGLRRNMLYSQQHTYYQPQQYQQHRTTKPTYNNANHTYQQVPSRRITNKDIKTTSDDTIDGRGGNTGTVDGDDLKGDRDLRVEEGSGTYGGWDYVYKNLESQGYSKDLGERGDILVSDRSGKRRVSTTAAKSTTELTEKFNALTLNPSDKPKHKSTNYEPRSSDETQSSHYDNIPTTVQQFNKSNSTSKPTSNTNNKSQSEALMQQKMKINRLSEVKAKVDSRRSSGEKNGMKEISRVDSTAVKSSGMIINGLGLRKTTKQPSPPTTNTADDMNLPTTSNLRPLLTKSTATSPKSPPSTTTWECSSCTFHNTITSKDINICEMCSKSRDVALLDTSMEIGGPQCLNCTLVNPKGAAVCQVCENTLNNSPTYI